MGNDGITCPRCGNEMKESKDGTIYFCTTCGQTMDSDY
jgi:transposase